MEAFQDGCPLISVDLYLKSKEEWRNLFYILIDTLL